MSDQWPEDWPIAAIRKIEEAEEERDQFSKSLMAEERRANEALTKLDTAHVQLSSLQAAHDDLVFQVTQLKFERLQQASRLDTALQTIERERAQWGELTAELGRAESRLGKVEAWFIEWERQITLRAGAALCEILAAHVVEERGLACHLCRSTSGHEPHCPYLREDGGPCSSYTKHNSRVLDFCGRCEYPKMSHSEFAVEDQLPDAPGGDINAREASGSRGSSPRVGTTAVEKQLRAESPLPYLGVEELIKFLETYAGDNDSEGYFDEADKLRQAADELRSLNVQAFCSGGKRL